jgi:hypothetical protein
VVITDQFLLVSTGCLTWSCPDSSHVARAKLTGAWDGAVLTGATAEPDWAPGMESCVATGSLPLVVVTDVNHWSQTYWGATWDEAVVDESFA